MSNVVPLHRYGEHAEIWEGRAKLTDRPLPIPDHTQPIVFRPVIGALVDMLLTAMQRELRPFVSKSPSFDVEFLNNEARLRASLGHVLREFIASGRAFEPVFENQVRTAVRTCIKQVRNLGKPGLLVAPTQSGKTAIQQLVALLLPLIGRILCGPDTNIWVVTMLPPHILTERQTSKDSEVINKVFGQIIYQDDKNQICLRELADNNANFAIQQEKEIDGESGSILKRTNSELSGLLTDVVEKADKAGAHLVILTDEFHWGSSVNGNIGKMFMVLYNDLRGVSNGNITSNVNTLQDYREAAQGQTKHSLIFVSATSYPLINSRHIWKVRHSLVSSVPYQGYNFACGHTIDAEAERRGLIRPLPVFSFSAFQRVVTDSHAPHSRYYCPEADLHCDLVASTSAYENEKAWKTELKRRDSALKDYYDFDRKTKKVIDWHGNEATHSEYRRNVEFSLVTMLNHLLVDHNPHNGQGAIMRFASSNARMRELAATLRETELDENINIILYCLNDSASAKQRTYLVEKGPGIYQASTRFLIEDTIHALYGQPGVPANGKYIIMVSGSGRMGMQLPRLCCYGIDGTASTTSMTTFQQGTHGRLSGFGKDSLLLVSAKNARNEMVMRQSKGIYGMKPDSRTKRVDDVPRQARTRTTKRLMLDRVTAMQDPLLRQRWERIEADLQEMRLHAYTGNYKKSIHGARPEPSLLGASKGFYYGMFDEGRLDEDAIRHIEESSQGNFLDVQILRPNQRGRFYDSLGVYEWLATARLHIDRKIADDVPPGTPDGHVRLSFRNASSAEVYGTRETMNIGSKSGGYNRAAAQNFGCLPLHTPVWFDWDERAKRWRLSKIILRLTQPAYVKPPELVWTEEGDEGTLPFVFLPTEASVYQMFHDYDEDEDNDAPVDDAETDERDGFIGDNDG